MRHALLSTLLVCAIVPCGTEAALSLSAFLGTTHAHRSTVRLVESVTTDVQFSNVRWESQSFIPPVYYCIRIEWEPCLLQKWAFGLDFTHAKLYAVRNNPVVVRGKRNGFAVDGSETLSYTFRRLSFSHGCNLLALTALHKWQYETEEPLTANFAAYTGLGWGIAVPHAEIETASLNIYRYLIGGPALESIAGLNLYLMRWLGVGVEYKFSWSFLNVRDGDVAKVSTHALLHHFVAGLTLILTKGNGW